MINLEIVTPERKVVDVKADLVTIPTAKGEIGILPNHAPLISILRSGILSYLVAGKTDKLVISGGFVEVSDNKISILADIAENKEEIDLEGAQSEKADSEKVLGAWKGTEEEFEVELEKLEKAQARLALGSAK
ncbi:MAG: ATP synthase F1 subunit epsilon [Acidobacteriota bacterium]|nr:ATP synthase F1 subunit epsilon [Acidobacteriota bacterium]MDH3529027.1 ATP synthase F1 subunit epsilon [Acidobacteriota bacterium]